MRQALYPQKIQHKSHLYIIVNMYWVCLEHIFVIMEMNNWYIEICQGQNIN